MKQKIIGILTLFSVVVFFGCSNYIDELTPKEEEAPFKSQTKTLSTASDHSLDTLTSAESENEGVVTVTKNDDGTVTLTSVAAGATTVTVTGTGTNESGKSVLTTVTYAVTVAKDGKITCTESGSQTARCETITPQNDNTDFKDTTGAKSRVESVAKATVNDDGTVTVVAAGAGETKVSVKGKDENKKNITLIYDVKVDSDGEITIGENPTVFKNMTETIDPTETVEGFITESVMSDDEDGDVITVAKKDDGMVSVTSQDEGVTKVHVNGKAPNGDDVTITYEVKVSEEGDITIDKDKITVFIHKREKIDPKTDGSLESVTEATSEPEEIITLTENDGGTYTVTAQKEGETTITVVGKKGDDIITVTYKVKVADDGTLTVGTPAVFTNATETISPKEDNEDLKNITSAESAPEGIITLTDNGNGTYTVTAQKAGTATITVTGTDADGEDVTVTYTAIVADDGTLTVNAELGIELKTGGDINALLATVVAKDTATAFVKSDTAPAEGDIKGYLDIAETVVPVWADTDGKQILYYVPDGKTMRLNEDSSGMFTDFTVLTKIETKSWNTSAVTNMSKMFYNCKKLDTLDLAVFKTAKLTNMSGMFYYCAFTSLDLSNFDTAKVTNMSSMFQLCNKLTSLTLNGKFNTASVTDMSYMFKSIGNKNFTTLDVSGLDTTNVTNMSYMFAGCSKYFTTLDLSNFNTAKVTDMSHMFDNSTGLTTLNLKGFNTANVTDMNNMFLYCKALTTLDVSSFNTAKVTDMSYMFSNCQALTELDLSNFDTANVKTMERMFDTCKALATLNVSKFDTRSVTTMYRMFCYCPFTTLDVSSFDTANVTNMSEMFANNTKLAELDLTNFNTANVTDMSNMFVSCKALTSLDLSKFNTAKVTDMNQMFNTCSALVTIYASDSFETTAVKTSDRMFTGCTKLVGGNGTAYNASNVTATYARIDGVPTGDTQGYFTGLRYALTVPASVENGSVTASPSGTVTAGALVTLTATPDSGYALRTLTVTDADGNEITLTQDAEEKTKYTFTMPESDVTVSVYYGPYYGKKAPSEAKAVGDIVFTDGSAIPYAADLELTDEQKEAAIAVIFYVGTGLNSGSDTTTSRTLGVGLVHDRSGLSLCENSSNGSAKAYSKNITTIQCTPSGNVGAYTFTGDKNGSDNLEQISDFLGDDDDTATETNYPAFYFAKNYASQEGSHVSGTDYADGWYLPTIAELFQIWKSKTIVDAASKLCGGSHQFDSFSYWSSSQWESNVYVAYMFYFRNGEASTNSKNFLHMYSVCAIREF